MKRSVSFVLCALAVAALAACKPSVGGSCTENAHVCNTPTSRMACSGGHYVEETCKGPNGCKEVNGNVTCDSSHGDVGDPCASANQYVCSTDNKLRLRCDDNKLVFISRCAGIGCTNDDRGDGHCGNPFAKEGDPCKAKSENDIAAGACSEDGKRELACKNGKMVLAHACRGEEACSALTSGPVCDRSTALPGDPCDPNDPELAVACDPTGESIMVCKNHKFVQGPRCGGENKCGVAKYGIDGRRHFKAGCDQSLSNVGDDCIKDGGLACSVDLKSRLTCQNGKFVLDKPCKGKDGCQVHAPDGSPFACAEK
ncbi:MAG TPA: hypothetical protein VLM85_13105 [Polyangiaceae bacterium]|nr:hypothetical protein [Polyangiaceae bacterium]